MSDSTEDDVDRFAWLRATSGLGSAFQGILLSLIALTVGAWALTLHQALTMSMPMGVAVRGGMSADGMAGMAMAGMSGAAWSLTNGLTFVAIWTIMMAAMMLPAAAPMIAIFSATRARSGGRVVIPTSIFVAGYILVWAVAGVLVYIFVQMGSDAATGLVPTDRAKWAPLVLGTTLVAAGLYQFTAIKRICLRHCRSPFGFVLRYWRDGPWGALRMGVRHGAYCFGCCWVLFAVLVAAGVMSVAWMLLLTLVIFVEKTLPHGRIVSLTVGVAFAALGIAVATSAVPMPWVG